MAVRKVVEKPWIHKTTFTIPVSSFGTTEHKDAECTVELIIFSLHPKSDAKMFAW